MGSMPLRWIIPLRSMSMGSDPWDQWHYRMTPPKDQCHVRFMLHGINAPCHQCPWNKWSLGAMPLYIGWNPLGWRHMGRKPPRSHKTPQTRMWLASLIHAWNMATSPMIPQECNIHHIQYTIREEYFNFKLCWLWKNPRGQRLTYL